MLAVARFIRTLSSTELLRSRPARRTSSAWRCASTHRIACISLGLALAITQAASAQEEIEDESDEPASAAEAASAPAPVTEESPSPALPAPTWWFGAWFQGAFVPSFMLELFLDEAPTVANVGFGFTATHRGADGMSLVIGIGYAGYGFDGPFRIKGDPEVDTEYLSSSLGLLHLRGQILWSTDIVKDKLSFEYGVGLDLGLVLGSLKRSEAYRDPVSGEFAKCAGPANPVQAANYCEPPLNLLAGTDPYNSDGAHYNVTEKRVPPVALVPMLPALALRYTPIRELAIRLDAAFGLLQFSVGLSAQYGLDF